ncbi:MAG: hypothetical protein V4543_14585 [Bacteroidota bacterium]
MDTLTKTLRKYKLEVKTYGVTDKEVYDLFEKITGQADDYMFCDLIISKFNDASQVLVQAYYLPSFKDTLVFYSQNDILKVPQESLMWFKSLSDVNKAIVEHIDDLVSKGRLGAPRFKKGSPVSA